MEKPIRVLHVLQRMESGGTQALLMNLYRNIDRNKVQFDFFVEYPEKQFYDDEIKELGGRIFYNTFRRDLNIFKFERALYKVLKTGEYTIVHCHAYTIGYFALKTAKKAGVPVRIAHSHNNGAVHDFKYLPKLFMQKIFTIYATDLFACSEEAGKYLFKNKEFTVLKNAIDSDKFVANSIIRKEVRDELQINEKFVIGHVGRLHNQKNHKFLLQIFKEIKKKKKNSVILLIGTGPLEVELKEYAKSLGIIDSVKFLGARKDVNRIYQSMDVFILPSVFEGLGIVAVEAQAAGIPTLCSTGVSSEANVSPLFFSKDLHDSVTSWANKALEISNNKLAHTDTKTYIIDHKYDVQCTASTMQKYYLMKGGRK